ncbi:MAG: hypothetical protein Fur005_41090 [Roseiflexaceae bacterium]
MHNEPLPHAIVGPRPPGSLLDIFQWDWQQVPALAPFRLSEYGQLAQQQTTLRICGDSTYLYTRFDCQDTDIWGIWTRRDDPIYNEEAIELFIAPGSAIPTSYYEFEVSPTAVIFDAIIENPTSLRRDMTADTAWDCPGLRVAVDRDDFAQHWTAIICIPWAAISPERPIPRFWRANFYRIERPRHGQAEFSAWSPTLVSPADFHKPARFGLLELADQVG